MLIFLTTITVIILTIIGLIICCYLSGLHVERTWQANKIQNELNYYRKEIIRLKKNIEYKNKKLRELRYAYRQITENQSFDEGQR